METKNRQKDLPPKTIKIGDLVRYEHGITTIDGFVVGDNLSPGGMIGFFKVALIVDINPHLERLHGGGWKLGVSLQYAMLPADKLKPTDFKGNVTISVFSEEELLNRINELVEVKGKQLISVFVALEKT